MTSETTVDGAVAPARRGRPGYDRDQVLAIAVQLFNEQGYDATSVADLAQRLELSKSALYHHFDSKEQLLALALDTALSGLEAVVEEAVATSEPAVQQLDRLVRGAVGVLIDHLPSVTLLLRVRGNSAVELAAMERRRRFDQRVTALVRSAQDEGDLRADVDAPIAARLIFGMLNSIVEWYRPEGSADREVLADDILAVALDGMRRSARAR